MTYLPPGSTVLQITLQPQDPVLALQCPPDRRAQLEVLSGRLWLTQHGRSDDWFLECGQGMTLNGAAQLYASAEGPEPLRLRWVLEHTSVADTPPMPRQRPQRLGLSS